MEFPESRVSLFAFVAGGSGHHLFSLEGLVAHWAKTQPTKVQQLQGSLLRVLAIYHQQVASTKEAAERRRREVGRRMLCELHAYFPCT